MRVRIFDNAKLDLVDGFAFYENQADGVGHYFLDSLFADIDSLALYAGTHRKRPEGFHWMLSKRFPYAVYYTVVDDLVSVHAVLDSRQDPGQIEERLRQERTRRWSQ
ncbi:MAG: type II toxin-antitoxin system RelE/ParE family toxin [Opitutales bacterium]|nr:type II toxin-antitoxin system RelE/ParE family toxin [Opitutales bacterium]